jgi:protein-disulfide isomerase
MATKKPIKKTSKMSKAQKLVDEVAAESKNPKKEDSIKLPDFKFSWKTTAIVLGVLLIASLVFNFSGGIGASISGDAAADRVEVFIKENVQGVEVEVTEKTQENGLHKIELVMNGPQGPQPLTVYVTKDGTLMFPSAIPLTGSAIQQQVETAQQQVESTITKSDKPTVELFIMSHCPFGTQAEKGMLPVAELLGDNIDFEIKFVNYAMHGEKEVNEQTRQYCIAQEQSDKYFDYLWSFLDSDDYAQALKDANIDETKLASCITITDKTYKITELLEDESTWSGGRFPQFNIHADENTKYGVQGSPTLVINGKQVSSARDSASFLSTVCAAFNNAPEECEQELSSTAPSPGFGLEGTGSASAATCG